MDILNCGWGDSQINLPQVADYAGGFGRSSLFPRPYKALVTNSLFHSHAPNNPSLTRDNDTGNAVTNSDVIHSMCNVASVNS